MTQLNPGCLTTHLKLLNFFSFMFLNILFLFSCLLLPKHYYMEAKIKEEVEL